MTWYVKMPAKVTVVNIEGTPMMLGPKPMVIGLAELVVEHLSNDEESYGGAVKKLRAGLEIVNAFKDRKPGEIVNLTDDQRTGLKALIERGSPTLGWPPFVLRQLLPLLGAVLEATETEPASSKDPHPERFHEALEPGSGRGA